MPTAVSARCRWAATCSISIRKLSPVDERPQVAVVVAEGEIAGGEQPAGSIGGESTAALLRDARDDDDVKAVVLRVDSPGGEVYASEQIRREVVALKEAGKPVVVSMGDLAASGGYWISMNADRIYADPSTITGSIGIFGMIPTIPRTLEKIGVHTDGVGTTKFAGAFDITRPLAPEVGAVVQSVIDKGYRDFTGRVATARKRTFEQIDAVARGRVWSGAQAKERGLVDAFGGLQDAIDDAATRAKLGKQRRLPRALHREDGDAVRTLLHRLFRQPHRQCVVAAVGRSPATCWRRQCWRMPRHRCIATCSSSTPPSRAPGSRSRRWRTASAGCKHVAASR